MSSRSFPALKESDIRRLVSASVFKKGMRLWDADAVISPTLGAHDVALFAHVREARETCRVIVQHLAGDEFAVHCDCNDDGLCAHAVATLLAWTYSGYAFGTVETPSDELTPEEQRKQQWRDYLRDSNLAHLRAIARRHQVALRSSERTNMLEQLVETLSAPDAQRLSEFILKSPAAVPFFEPGQPRVDRPGGGRVHAHEPVAQQPDDLVAVPGLLIEQPQQVQPEAAMAEYRTQLASPSISLSLSGCGALVRAPCAAVRRSARRSSMTRPDMVLTDTCPEPAPRLPLTV